jgi:hypothetical protein
VDLPEGSVREVKRHTRNKKIEDDHHRNSKVSEDIARIIGAVEYDQTTIERVNAIYREDCSNEFIEIAQVASICSSDIFVPNVP